MTLTERLEKERKLYELRRARGIKPPRPELRLFRSTDATAPQNVGFGRKRPHFIERGD
jgi:hypothetical protein